jgi:hypothetical protein
MNEDILLPVDLPAEALKLAWWQVSCLQGVNDRFQSVAITGRANRECRLSTHLRRTRGGRRMTQMGNPPHSWIAGGGSCRMTRSPGFRHTPSWRLWIRWASASGASMRLQSWPGLQ